MLSTLEEDEQRRVVALYIASRSHAGNSTQIITDVAKKYEQYIKTGTAR